LSFTVTRHEEDRDSRSGGHGHVGRIINTDEIAQEAVQGDGDR